MQDAIQAMVSERRWAVVGVSDDHQKFGRRIFESLRRSGYDVVPVHPTLTTLDDGTAVYAAVSAIPGGVAVVDLVIPPALTRTVVADALGAGVKHFWFQPGAEDDQAIATAEAAGATVISHGPCAMVEKRSFS